MQIFYVYYHSYDYVPMHASDVIEEMANQGVRLRVFTSVKPSLLQSCPWRGRVPVVNMPVVRARFLERLSYLIQLALLLPLWCIARRPDCIYERSSMNTVLTAVIARLMRIPLVCEVNGIVIEEAKLNRAAPVRVMVSRWCESISLRLSMLIITVNEVIAQSLTREYALPAQKIRSVPNGTNVERFSPRDTREGRAYCGLRDDAWPVVGYLGTLSPWCGVDLLINAARSVLERHPGAVFAIGGGEEPFLSRFAGMAHDTQLADHVGFFGQIPWSKASLFIAAFDIGVVSLAPPPISGSPQKLYAYLACGKPVVGSDIGEIGEVIRKHSVGELFEPRNAASLAKATLSLCERMKNGEEFAERTRRAVVENYSWPVRVGQLLHHLAHAAVKA